MADARIHESAGFELPVAVALANATRRVSEHPESPSHWGQLGKLLHAHEMFDRAVEAYDKAFELQPDNLSWLYLSSVASQNVDPNQAIARLQNCLELGFAKPFVALRLANQLERAGRLDAARKQYLSALATGSRPIHALIGMARLDLKSGLFGAAVVWLEEAREIAPMHGPTYPLLVQVYRKLEREDESRIAEILTHTYTQAIPITDPILAEVEALGISSNALSARGLLLASQGRLQEAEELFERVLNVRDGQVRDAINLGVVLARQQRFDEAIEVFTQAASSAPDHVGLLTNLGMALAQNGMLSDARESLERALQLNPSYPEALFNLANLHIRDKRFEDAASLLARALDANPGMLEARYNLAAALATIGKLDSAIQEWELLTKLRPSDGNVLYLLGSAYAQTSQNDKAVEQFERGRDAHPQDSRFRAALEALNSKVTGEHTGH